ncbi:MAG: 2,3-bisphosphoglycerate-independent phosphoglycerate mutase [Erysipelotrichales bacterium]
MKYLVLLLDGLSEDDTLQTSLSKANTPNLNKLLTKSILGKVNCVPDAFLVGSDVANMSVLGYDPNKYYTGRAYLELIAHKYKLNHNQVVYRANLVNIKDDIMEDFSSSNINSEDAYQLLDDLNNLIDKDSFFIKGASYHHLFVTKDSDYDLVPPHEIMNENTKQYLSNRKLDKLIEDSSSIINNRFNATNLWIWGKSTSIEFPSFNSKYNKKATLISAVDVVKGIGILGGMNVVEVEGATGDNKTNYKNKIDKTIKLFNEGYDMVYLHIEACDYCAHQGNKQAKINAIENIDSIIVSEILNQSNIRCLVLPDHHTSTLTKKHHRGCVPLFLYDSRNTQSHEYVDYNEKEFVNAKEFNVLDLMDILFEYNNT